MKNITKILFVAITSLSLMLTAKAGELTVNGSAKATYNATSGQDRDNGLGISNELNFTAAGELDNGFTWSYSMELDPNTGSAAGGETAGAAVNDDTVISLGMNDFGTIKLCVSECSTSKKYAFDASAYGIMSDTGLSEGIVYPDNASSFASVQYHTPELPYGTTLSVAHGNNKTDGQSSNAQGPASGNNSDSMTFYSLTTKPIDGLTASASYYERNDYANGAADSGDQAEEGGAYGLKYAYGNLTVGYGKSYKAPQSTVITAGATDVEYYENRGMSVGYAINDELSVSYSSEESEQNMQTSATTVYNIEMDSVQVAYSLGGATLSLARTDYENIGYAENVDAEETIIALAFAF
jgi:hypothetical protein